MHAVQKIIKNTGVIIIGNGIFRLLSMFVTIYLARYLGTAGFGKYSFVFVFIAFFGIIADMGLRMILIREMSREPTISSKLVGNAYAMKMFLAIPAVALPMLAITFMHYPTDTTYYVYVTSLTLIFFSFNDLYEGIFQANLSMKYSIIAKLSSKFISFTLILLVIFSHGTLLQILWILVFSEAVRMLINHHYSRKFVRLKLKIDFRLWKYLLIESMPLVLSSITLIICHHTDILMLSVLQGDSDVGIYSAAYKLVEPLNIIPYALMLSLFPLMSRFFRSSREKLIKTCGLGFKYVLLIVLPIVICVAILPDEIISLLYGEQFTASAKVLSILIWVLVFNSTNMVMGNFLVSIDRQSLYLFGMLFGAAMNVGFNFILIPMFGYNGAAIVTLATGITMFVANLYFISKSANYMVLSLETLKLLFSGLIMGVTLFVLKNFNIGIVPLIFIGVTIYFIGLYISKAFTEEDIGLFKKVIKAIRE